MTLNGQAHMNFLETITTKFQSLLKKNIVLNIYKELINNKNANSQDLIEFGFQEPLDLNALLQELIEKLDALDKDELRSIEGQVKAYLLTYIYYCTDHNPDLVKTTALATILYIKLLLIPNIGQYFFVRHIFFLQLHHYIYITLKSPILPKEMKINLMTLLEEYCKKEHLETKLFTAIVNVFLLTMMTCLRHPVSDVNEVPFIGRSAMSSLLELFVAERDELRLRTAMSLVFTVVTEKFSDYIDSPTAALSVIKLFVRDGLQINLNAANMTHFLHSFSYVWTDRSFNKFEEATEIMNVLNADNYCYIVKLMCGITACETKERYWEKIMCLMLAMAKNPPPLNTDVIGPYYHCTFGNIALWMIDKDKSKSNKVIEIIAEFCLLNQKNALTKAIFQPLERRARFGHIVSDYMITGLGGFAESKWAVSPRNQNLLIILMKIVSSCKVLEANDLRKTLQTICVDYTPNSMSPVLPYLHELFCQLMKSRLGLCAEYIMDIMYECAMHRDSISQRFLLHIFNSMTIKSTLKNHKIIYYTQVLLSERYNYKALFNKLQKYIGPPVIKMVIDNFNLKIKSFAVLLQVLLTYTPVKYDDSTVLLMYIKHNFDDISPLPAMGPLCVSLNKILSAREILVTDLSDLDRLFSLIVNGLFDQTYHVICVKHVYRLLLKLKSILDVDNDREMNQLIIILSERVSRSLSTRRASDLAIIPYLNELCLLMQKPPTPEVIHNLESLMENPDEHEVLKKVYPDVYVQLLSLFTIHALMRKSRTDFALKYLKEVLLDENPTQKIAGFRMYYTLCKTITRDYEPVIAFAFKEIISSHILIMKACLQTIEQLIHNNHLKLDHEQFYKFIHVIGCDIMSVYARTFMSTRFVATSQNDIAINYVRSLVYLHHYSGLSNYPITSTFDDELIRINLKMNCKEEIALFLFTNVSIKYKFYILSEISAIFDLAVKGECLIQENFFNLMNNFFLTFRYIQNPTLESDDIPKNYYENVMKFVELKIVNHCRSYKPERMHVDNEPDIRVCTLSILKFLFWKRNNISHRLQIPLFDAVMHWVDFVKDEIVNYIYQDGSNIYGKYFSELITYYNINKERFQTQKSFGIKLPDD